MQNVTSELKHFSLICFWTLVKWITFLLAEMLSDVVFSFLLPAYILQNFNTNIRKHFSVNFPLEWYALDILGGFFLPHLLAWACICESFSVPQLCVWGQAASSSTISVRSKAAYPQSNILKFAVVQSISLCAAFYMYFEDLKVLIALDIQSTKVQSTFCVFIGTPLKLLFFHLWLFFTVLSYYNNYLFLSLFIRIEDIGNMYSVFIKIIN